MWFFGGIMAVQRGVTKSVELVRQQEDLYNDLAGLMAVYPYYRYVLNHSPIRLQYHHRFLSTLVVGSLMYANFLA
jgi:hypothetical protein